jgi:hypothetical protein
MGIHFPKRRKECVTVCSSVLHFVGEVDFEIAGVPYPGGLLRMGKVKSKK